MTDWSIGLTRLRPSKSTRNANTKWRECMRFSERVGELVLRVLAAVAIVLGMLLSVLISIYGGGGG